MLAKIPESQVQPVKKEPEKPTVESYTLEEAYQKEMVRLKFEVREEAGGRRLSMVISNKSKSQFLLTLPQGHIRFEAGSPIDTLNINIDSDNSIQLGPGQSAPALEVGQIGRRGAVKGRFELTMHDGAPLYMGSVTIGTIE